MVDAAFNQADINQDNRLDAGEFRNFLGQNGVGGSANYSSSSYESSSSDVLGGGNYGASYGASSSDFGLAGGAAGGYDSSSSYSAGGAGYGATSAFGGESYGASSGEYSSSSSSAVQTYATDAQGLFKDSNPQIVRRPAPNGGQVTYTQNIRVRFLQPPPIPPPGVSLCRLVCAALY